jgi:hypothetical protein
MQVSNDFGDPVLHSRNFRLMLACNVISLTGSAVALAAAPFAVLAVGGSAGDVGYVATAMLVPVVVFLLLGGVVADRLRVCGGA